MKKKLSNIDLEIQNNPSKQIGLLTGTMSEAIFFGYLYLSTNKKEHFSKANNLINIILSSFEKEDITHTHCSGISGMAWGIQHFIELNLIDCDSKDLLNDINRYLLQFAKKDLSYGNWDFLHGALGVITYIIDLPYYQDYQEELEELMQLLYKQAEKPNENYLKWKMSINNSQDNSEYSYGLSHGSPGIIALATKCFKKGIHTKLSKKIARFTLNDLLSQVFEDKKKCYFPGIINSKGETNYTRLSWCYGDLSIAIILFQFAETFKDKEIKHLAKEIALHTTKRPIYTPLITDAGICHGAIGNAYMFSKLYKITGDKIFETTANKWLDRGLEMGNNKDGLAGFRIQSNSNEIKSYEIDTGILEGISGIGLCLIHFMNPKLRTDWDKFLLLS
jgi:lantibiotic modifying enzyme